MEAFLLSAMSNIKLRFHQTKENLMKIAICPEIGTRANYSNITYSILV